MRFFHCTRLLLVLGPVVAIDSPAAPAECIITPAMPPDASWLECIKGAGKYDLPEGTFILDRHFQMPDDVTILGAGPGKTIIEAAHAVDNGCGANADHAGDSTTRIGFVLGNNCRIGSFTFLGKDDHRWQDYYGAALCGGAVFETPGCSDAYCDSENIGDAIHGDGGVKGVTIEDVVISGKTPDLAPQAAVFITQTRDLEKPTEDVHIKGVHMDHSFCDGINLHGAVRNAVVEDCELSFQGDDNLAVWSAGALADNITFRNNIVSQARTENYANGRWGNCVALYGGNRINVINTTCYHSSNAAVKMSDDFKGSWGSTSSITIDGTVTDEEVPEFTTEKVGSGWDPEIKSHGARMAYRLPGWTFHSGENCYEGHGAVAVTPNTYAPDGNKATEGISPVACMAACTASTIPCNAVVTSTQGDCFLRTEVDLSSCTHGSTFDTWLYDSVSVLVI